MRQAARADANQPEIVRILRAAGATVEITHMLGSGFPDLVVGYRNKTYFIEIKDGSKPPSARLLTELEQAFCNRWAKCCPGVYRVVTSPKDALDAISR